MIHLNFRTIFGGRLHKYICISLERARGKSEDFERIFEEFYQVERYFTRMVGGIGFGLALAKRIMENAKGNIAVESKLGSGTTFILTFPF